MAVSRYQAEQGQTVRLGIRFELPTGDLYDPDSISQVEIMDADSVVIATIPAGSIVNEAVGVYHVDWAIPAAEALGKHYDQWSYVPVAGHAGTIAKLEFIVYAAGTFGVSDYYISVADAKAECLADSPLSDADVQYLIRCAMAIVDRVTGQHFVPVEEARDFDGSGSFWLKMNAPWQEILSIDNLDNDAVTYTIGDFRRKGSWIVHKDFLPWPQASDQPAHLSCGSDGTVFARGQRNIRVTARWGRYATCPDPVRQATCVLLSHAARYDRLDGAFVANMSRESSEGYSYVLRKIYNKAVIDNMTGYPDVDGPLVLYRRMNLGVSVK